MIHLPVSDSSTDAHRVATALRERHPSRFSRVIVRIGHSNVSLTGFVRNFHAKSLAFHVAQSILPHRTIVDPILVDAGRQSA